MAIKELTGRGRRALSICNPIILLVSRNEASLGKCFLCLKLRDTRFSVFLVLKDIFLTYAQNFQNGSMIKHKVHLLVSVWHFAIDFGGCIWQVFFPQIILLSCNISILHPPPPPASFKPRRKKTC